MPHNSELERLHPTTFESELGAARSAKARWAGKICCHFSRNLAFYQSWFDSGQPFKDKQFWISANGNFLDIAVLEWCKLFADKRGRHHFSKVLASPETFKSELLDKLELPENKFKEYVEEVKHYRDKFIAHLDNENVMCIPQMRVALSSVEFLYERILEQEVGRATFRDAPASAAAVYQSFLQEGLATFAK